MEPGDVLGGRFQILRLAGSGGMGQVFRARDRQTDRDVAIKCLNDIHADDVARFGREAQILAGLDHPHVVRYIAHGVGALSQPWLAMEWLDGEDLQARLARGPLAIDEGVELARRVASALAAAHARGIVHRDIKPSNVFLCRGRIDGVRIIDFGIASATSATRMTKTNVILGTAGYIAPEQTRSTSSADARADVFSLGALLFEALAGEPAFKGDHALAILTKILFDEAPWLRERRPAVPERLDALVHRMLSKNPDERPADGGAVVAELLVLEPMPEHGHADRGPRSAPLQEALTGGERRAIAIVLIGPPRGDDGAPVELSAAAFARDEDTLGIVAGQYGAHCERLLDGSFAVLLRGHAVVTDLCAQAARCALTLRAYTRGRPMALAMARTELTSKRPVSGAIERAVQILLRGAGGGAEGSVIAVDDVVAGLLDARFDVRAVDGMSSLYGERRMAEGVRTLLGKPTPLVGRDRDLRTLEGMFTECVDEPVAHAALVTAVPGIGKTRLAHDFWGRIRESHPRTTLWMGRGDALRAGSPFGLLRELVTHAAKLHDGEALDVRRAKLLTWVGACTPSALARELGAVLGEIAGVPFPDEAGAALRDTRHNPDTFGERIRGAWLAVLKGALATGPVAIILEDLHWGDLPSVELIDRALSDFMDRPLFVLALARPTVHKVFPGLWSKRRMQEVRLRELPRKASEQLVREVLQDSVGPETIERIVGLSAGNVFYLEELIRATAERRGDALPETVVAMVQSRLENLDEPARRLLRAASVFGQVFWTGAVAELVGGRERRAIVAEGLGELAAQELVTRRPESRFPSEEEYTFRHALLREGAYSMLLDEDRSLGHRLAVTWLEERGEQDPLLLAEHFEAGQMNERAAESWRRAAERATWAADVEACTRYARRGLALSPCLEVKNALLGLLCQAHVWRNEWVESAEIADELLKLATPGSAPWAQGFLARLMSTQAGAPAGDGPGPLAALDLLLRLEPEIDALASIVLSMTVLHFVTIALGRLDLAAACVARLEHLTTFPSETGSARAAREACLPLAHASRGLHAWTMGRYEDAEHAIDIALAARHRLGPAAPYTVSYLAEVRTDRGALVAARDVAMQLVAESVALSHTHDEGLGRMALSNALRGAGEIDAAEEEARKAAELLNGPLDRAPALASLAAALLAKGRVSEALTTAREATAIQGPPGQLAYRRAFVSLVHAQCLHAAGELAAAREAIVAARSWIESVASVIPDDGEKRSFLEGVVENRRTLECAREWFGL